VWKQSLPRRGRQEPCCPWPRRGSSYPMGTQPPAPPRGTSSGDKPGSHQLLQTLRRVASAQIPPGCVGRYSPSLPEMKAPGWVFPVLGQSWWSQGPAPGAAGWVHEQAAAQQPAKPLLKPSGETRSVPPGFCWASILRWPRTTDFTLHVLNIEVIPEQISVGQPSTGGCCRTGSGAVGGKAQPPVSGHRSTEPR